MTQYLESTPRALRLGMPNEPFFHPFDGLIVGSMNFTHKARPGYIMPGPGRFKRSLPCDDRATKPMPELLPAPRAIGGAA